MLEALAAAPRLRLALCLILVFHLCHSGVLKCAAQAPAAAPAPPPIPPPADRKLPADEKSTLQAIAKKLNISTSVWNFSTNPCSETGGWLNVDKSSVPEVLTNVTCGDCNTTSNVCHVISVMLKTTNLVGVIPEEFSNLSHLVQLDLSRNYLTGSIPVSLAKLPLINLTLIGNRLTGKIPTEIGNITTLQSIVLENNLLEGPLPPSLGNLTSLGRLLLSANNFVGKLPDSLGNLKTLTDFRIDGSNITGNIPDFIGNWAQLTRLDMQGTSLEGSFPRAFSTLSKLQQLRVTDFKGDGKFPELSTLEKIEQLILRNCSINGQIPDYLGELKDLKTLDLSFNNLSGVIPDSLSSMVATKGTKIKFLYLTSNRLVGNIPEAFLSTKINIDLSYNQFSGPSRDRCQASSNVNLVSSMQSSQNSVMIPCLKKNYPCSGVAKNYQLFINCGGQRMTINGTEYVADNGDTAGESLFSEKGPWALSSTGDFVGDESARYLKTNTSILKTSSALYLTARGSASSLKYYGLCLQTGNYTVKLHFAEIVFRDDNTYYSVGRRFFDVMIQGKKELEDFNIADEAKGAGREIVKNFTAEVNNNNTLEIEFRWSGKGTNAIPDRGNYGPLISAISVEPLFTPRTNFDESKGLSGGAIAGIVIGCCVAVLLIVVIPFILLRKKEQENEELRQLKLQGAFFSLKQIKVATKNFDLQNKIGEGGFGPVYKGVLPDGSVVAVKQLSSKSKQGNREFVNEIGMISALQHPNLVRLFGCCIESNQLLLVYEYLENNSLARALFGPEATRLKLDWQRRRMITLDIARGLAYLHEESRLKIVHRDIKATNILLDKDLNAKISDFGLAKLDDEENTHISTRIAGTIGYMAPEYAMRGYLTEKADVYSFGIVLLEIVSGKSNTNYRPKEDFVYLLDWAYVLKDKGSLLELVDPSLGTNFPQAEADQLLNLALMCANPSPTLRPTMTSVVSMIEAGTLVSAPSAAPIRTLSDEMRFKAFEKLSYDTQALSTDGPWMNSSVTMSTNPDLTETSSTSRLIDDTSMASV